MPTVTEVGVRLPIGWQEVDPRSPDRHAEFDRALRAVWCRDGEPDEFVARIVAELSARLGERLNRDDVLLVGFTGRVVPLPDQLIPGVVSASVTMALLEGTVAVPTVRDRLPELGVESIALSAGSAVRAAGIVADTSGPVFRCDYLVPVPGRGQVLLLAFSTPNTDLADAYQATFDIVARSLEFAA